MIDLVVSDIDGTLIGPDERLSYDMRALVKRLQKKGVFFSVATGRVESMANPLVEQMGLTLPYVACNGAVVVKGEKVFRRLQFPVKNLRSFVDVADKKGLSIIYTIEGKEYVWRDAPYILNQRKQFGRYNKIHRFSESEWDTLKVDKISIMSDRDDETIAELEHISQLHSDIVRNTRYLDRSVELVHKDATKETGVRFLCELLNIPIDRVMFIGDHQNDIELIVHSGIGVAVGNSTEDAKKIADYVCKESLDRGVVEALRRFIPGVAL